MQICKYFLAVAVYGYKAELPSPATLDCGHFYHFIKCWLIGEAQGVGDQLRPDGVPPPPMEISLLRIRDDPRLGRAYSPYGLLLFCAAALVESDRKTIASST